MNVVKAVLNKAKLESKFVEKFNCFKGLKYRIVEKTNSAVSKKQVQLLLDVETDLDIYKLRMFLIGIFMHGIRTSDLLLLRNEDFKKNKI
jgi:integrase